MCGLLISTLNYDFFFKFPCNFCGDFRQHVIPMIITCMLQGTPCDTGFPCTLYGEIFCSLVFLPIKITLKRFLEGFFERLKILSKNPSRNCLNVILMTKKTRLKYFLARTLYFILSISFHFSDLFDICNMFFSFSLISEFKNLIKICLIEIVICI